eukprot:Tamp_10150.p1 GENE.Tamp_10150~~Tamp_10150.p1  ORF type:complete len:422 (+),score=94.73 Tamp_10150:279-1544(+)
MGFGSSDGEKLVEAAGARAAKAQEGLAGPKPEHGEHGAGASGAGSSPSQCDEPMGDHGSASVHPSPRLPCSSAAIDEADERDAVEQAAIASIILQLSQQPPATKRRRVRTAPGSAHSEHHEGPGGRHAGGDGHRRRSGGEDASGARASAASQPPTPQPPPSTPAGGVASMPAFANFPDPVRQHHLPLPHGGMPPLPQLSLAEGIQGNTLPAIVTIKDREAMHTHLPPPADGVFQQSALASASKHQSLYAFPGTLAGAGSLQTGGAAAREGGGGGSSGDASSGEQARGMREGSGMHEASPSSTPRDGGDGHDGGGGAAAGGGTNRSAEVRRPYRCSKCGAEKKGHLCSAKLAGNMMPATPVKRVDLAARLAARLHAGAGEGGEGMEVEGRGGLQANDLSHLPFFRSFRMLFLLISSCSARVL